jgi:glycosyltransferase EpsH
MWILPQKDMKAISVIIPVYNTEQHLRQCLDSVLAQSFTDFEIILVDDGSTDGSELICDEYAQKDSRVRVIHQTNQGVSPARNAAMKIAEGKYITFIDSDDFVDDGFFMHAYNTLEKNGCELYISGLIREFYDKDGHVFQTLVYSVNESHDYTVREFLEDLGVNYEIDAIYGTCDKFYRRSIIEEHDITYDVTMNIGEDTTFNFEYLKYVNKIHFTSLSFYHYRKWNADSLSTKSLYRKDLYEINCKVFDRIYQTMKNAGCSEESLERFNRFYISSFIEIIKMIYAFYDKCTTQEKMAIMEKISENDLVRKCSVREFPGLKLKMLLGGVKYHVYPLIHVWYSLKNRISPRKND